MGEYELYNQTEERERHDLEAGGMAFGMITSQRKDYSVFSDLKQICFP